MSATLIFSFREPLAYQELRNFMDSILVIDQDLVTDTVRTLALETITTYQNGGSLKWNDAELGVYLVYIFGEINKSECNLRMHYRF